MSPDKNSFIFTKKYNKSAFKQYNYNNYRGGQDYSKIFLSILIPTNNYKNIVNFINHFSKMNGPLNEVEIVLKVDIEDEGFVKKNKIFLN